MGIIRNPCCSLARIARTYERIRDGVTLAQIGVIDTARARVRVPRLQGTDGERWEKRRVGKSLKSKY